MSGAAARGPVALRLPRGLSAWEILARDALFALVRQWQRGFDEARHVLPFPPEQGFSGSRTLYAGDVFARALICDALCDAHEHWGQLDALIDAEIEHLLAARRTTGVQGWSYFPEVSELPPDADDLAQVMTVLARRGRRASLRETCEPPLEVLLRDNARPDGSFETWIVPRDRRTAEQQLQAEWIERAWGGGCDVEVVANVLHALRLYDAARFAEPLAAGARYLTGCQAPDGSWPSTWYWGPYYGTYAVLRVLAAVPEAGAAVRAGAAFLSGAQRADGSWGWGECGDPLSTALALAALAGAGALETCAGAPALAYLEAARGDDQLFTATPLVRMDLGRATGHVHQTLAYGSRAVSTGFVLKAALAVQAAAGGGGADHVRRA